MVVSLPGLLPILTYLACGIYILFLTRRHTIRKLPSPTHQRTLIQEVPTPMASKEVITNEQMTTLFTKMEPYFARIASALEVANQLETQKQVVQFEQKHVESDASRTVQELSNVSPGAAQELSREEIVKQYLFGHPGASLREVERETGVPKTSVAIIKNSL